MHSKVFCGSLGIFQGKPKLPHERRLFLDTGETLSNQN
uniref:Uncharacterized protein n=1 Tax=Anguilla anguilla TaxID=7936 RepID=A0A0E9SNE0_ANGAN